MLKNWIFAYKLPDVGYGVKFSKSILEKLTELKAQGLLIEIIDENEIILMPVMDKGDMNIVIESGWKKGQIKPSFNRRTLHYKLIQARFFSANEILEDVYGYRFSMEWSDKDNAFKIQS